MDPAVAAALESYPAALRDRLMQLRTLIYETAAETEGVGPLEETLKWGEVSYLTTESGSGTTVRIARDKRSGQPTIFVNCQTDLVSRYRTLYPDAFDYDGDRGVVLGEAPDRAALKHVIALALTYHAGKRRRSSTWGAVRGDHFFSPSGRRWRAASDEGVLWLARDVG